MGLIRERVILGYYKKKNWNRQENLGVKKKKFRDVAEKLEFEEEIKGSKKKTGKIRKKRFTRI